MKKVMVLIGLLVLSNLSNAQSYNLIWSDEFNGTSVDQNKWVFESGNNNGWGNNELEYYTNRTNNAYIDNGNLVIKAIKENYDKQNYTSARIKTQGKFSITYGKIEARIKLPYGKGIWPAFWMLGDAISFVGWPKCGEIDIMEMTGGGSYGDKTVYGTAHWDNNNSHAQYGLSYRLPSGNLSDDFHILDITWDSQKIIWHIDSIQYCRLDLNSSLSAFQKPFFILLNLAVGGRWPGYPDNTTVFPQTMTVDYVRVYQLASDVGEDNSQIPKEFSLSQNFPNPFNPSTVIGYQLPVSENVSLKVYDLFGKEVRTLVNEFQQAGGHNCEFRLENGELASGIYFYQLITGNKFETKKMVLLK